MDSESPRATVPDAVFAVAVLGVRAGLVAGGALVRAVRPVGEVLVYADRWPSETVRVLAGAGARYRRAARDDLVRRYRAVVPVVVTEVLDLAGVTRRVMAEVDLARIVQEATASVVSENVRGVRTQAYQADQTVSRWVDRALRRAEP